MEEVSLRLNKARSEVNLAENTLGRALYAMDKAIEEVAAFQPAPTPGTASSPLPALDISRSRLWKYTEWHASEWDNAFSGYPWRSKQVQWQSDDSVLFVLDNSGAPELQAPSTANSEKGFWQADVTLPEKRDGLCVAPLWLYNHSGKKGEIDFEFTKDGLLLTLHSEHTGAHKQFSAPIIPMDWAGKRYLFGIKYDNPAGVIEMLLDGEVIHTFNRADAPDAFPTEPLRTYISMWTAKAGLGWAEGWLGKWGGIVTGERLTMIVHGYKFEAL